MKHTDLRDFVDKLEKMGELKRVRHEVDALLEITEICDRTLKAEGPALLFENVLPVICAMPVAVMKIPAPARAVLLVNVA